MTYVYVTCSIWQHHELFSHPSHHRPQQQQQQPQRQSGTVSTSDHLFVGTNSTTLSVQVLNLEKELKLQAGEDERYYSEDIVEASLPQIDGLDGTLLVDVKVSPQLSQSDSINYPHDTGESNIMKDRILNILAGGELGKWPTSRTQ